MHTRIYPKVFSTGVSVTALHLEASQRAVAFSTLTPPPAGEAGGQVWVHAGGDRMLTPASAFSRHLWVLLWAKQHLHVTQLLQPAVLPNIFQRR